MKAMMFKNNKEMIFGIKSYKNNNKKILQSGLLIRNLSFHFSNKKKDQIFNKQIRI
jgi:hypothetical protein